jgi:hypothetical protein
MDLVSARAELEGLEKQLFEARKLELRYSKLFDAEMVEYAEYKAKCDEVNRLENEVNKLSITISLME